MNAKKPPEAPNPRLAELRRRTAKASTDPGIYKWLGKEGEVLYVGKAKNLKNRLKSYVQEKPDLNIGPWKLSLIRHIADFDTTVTNSELEALILETNLIKELKPKYNVLMKDDKNYVYVRIGLQNPYPDVGVVRRTEHDGAKYFGPFLSAYDTKRTLDVLQEIFNYREDRKALEKLNRAAQKGEDHGRAHPSLDFQIGQSCGIAMGKISKEEYRSRIDAVVAFFKGNRSTVLKQATALMQEAAQNRKFEKAAKLRDTVRFMEEMRKEQIVSGTSGEDTDTFAVAMSGSKALIVALRERGGKLIGEQSFPLRGEPDSPAEALEQFLPQYYSSVPDLPDLVVIGEEIEDAGLLSAWLTEQKGRTVEVRMPERGKKSKVLQLAERNATEKVKQLEAKWESAVRNIEEALVELTEALHLPEKPRRIEGYDISHLGGTETVGSMAVTINGKPAPKDYRSFTIQTLKEGDIDDYRALEEVLRRRLKYLTQDLKLEEEQWKREDITFGKVRKAEQKAVDRIHEENYKEINNKEIDYRKYLVARKEDVIIGFCRMVEHEGGHRELKSLWVRNDVRGKHLGQFLVRKMLSMQKNTKKVYVTVRTSLEEYYSNLGFRHTNTHPPIVEKKLRIAEKEKGVPPGIVMVYIYADHKKDISLSEKPDLLLIDGGKGQLGSAVKVLKEYNLDIPVIGLAKQEEELFLPDTPHPIPLPKDSQAQFLLQRIRNEAHRFANEHRKKRIAKHTISSALDDVPGIGAKMKQALLTRFGAVRNIQEASDEELRNIISDTQLKALRTHLQK